MCANIPDIPSILITRHSYCCLHEDICYRQCTVNCNKNLLFDLDGESSTESTSTHTHFSSVLSIDIIYLYRSCIWPTFVAVFIYPGSADSVPILAEGSYVAAVARQRCME